MLKVEAGTPQGFIGVDVAHSGDQPLIKQSPFDRGTSQTDPIRDRCGIEVRVEGVEGDVGYRVQGAFRHHLESTEHALIEESQLGPVIEIEEHPGVAQLGIRRLVDQNCPLIPRWVMTASSPRANHRYLPRRRIAST